MTKFCGSWWNQSTECGAAAALSCAVARPLISPPAALCAPVGTHARSPLLLLVRVTHDQCLDPLKRGRTQLLPVRPLQTPSVMRRRLLLLLYLFQGLDVAEADDLAVLLLEQVHDQVARHDLTVRLELDRRSDALVVLAVERGQHSLARDPSALLGLRHCVHDQVRRVVCLRRVGR